MNQGTEQNNQSTRIPSLDGLRALSIALVVADHLLSSFGARINTFQFGNLGVRIFFVISGFLITSILIAEMEKTASLDLKKFFLRRTLRIFPAYYFFLLFIFVLSLLGFYQIAPEKFIAPLTYTTNFVSTGVEEFVHTWSLAVEEQFYLLLPALFLLCGLRNLPKLLLLVVLAVPFLKIVYINVFHPFSGIDVSYHFLFGFQWNMDILAAGCLLAFYRAALHENRFYRKFLDSALCFLALPVIVVAIGSQSDRQLLFFGVGQTVMNLSIVLWMDWIVTNHRGFFGKILNLAPLRFVGALSYSIYLWQQPFTVYAERTIWYYFPLNIVLMIAFSLFSYYFIERKFLALRHKLEKRWFAEKPEETFVPQPAGLS